MIFLGNQFSVIVVNKKIEKKNGNSNKKKISVIITLID